MTLTSELRLHRHHAIAALLGIALLSLCWIAAATIHAHFAKDDEISQLRTSIAALSDRLAKTIAPPPRKEIAAAAVNPSVSSSIAQNTELAERHVQTALRQLPAQLRSSAVQIEAVRSLPLVAEGGLTTTRFSVALTVPAGSAFDTINLLEASTPAVLIESVRMTSRPGLGQSQDAVRIQLIVRTYAFATAGDAKK